MPYYPRIARYDAPPEGATPVPGYEQFYSATPDGRVFSHNYRHTGKTKELAQTTHPEGYRRVRAHRINKRDHTPVHRIIALTFIPNPLNLPQVNHLDGDKGHNHFTNLEWCTNAENQKHAFRTGLQPSKAGENHPGRKLTLAQVIEIREWLSLSSHRGQLTELAAIYGVSKHCIYDIKRGRSWT